MAQDARPRIPLHLLGNWVSSSSELDDLPVPSLSSPPVTSSELLLNKNFPTFLLRYELSKIYRNV